MQVGYSIMLDMDEDAINIIKEYFELYDICEIKLEEEDVKSPLFSRFVEFVNTEYPNRVSYHLKNDLLDQFDNYGFYIKMISSKMKSFNGYFIIHMPSNIISLDNVERLKNMLPDGATLLFENPSNLTVDLFNNLMVESLRNYKNCFDIGHAMKNAKSTIELYEYVDNFIQLDNVIEMHIHNVINSKDHQKFENDIPQEIIAILKQSNYCHRFILEIKKMDVFSQEAYSQFRLIKNVL